MTRKIRLNWETKPKSSRFSVREAGVIRGYINISTPRMYTEASYVYAPYIPLKTTVKTA
jgi:hypothetical protein